MSATARTPREVCRYLRWKALFVGAEPDPRILGTADECCWCVHTQTCLGPDGEVADPARCLPGRGCFAPL